MRSYRRTLLALTMAILSMLSACGFKLRSAADIALPFKTIYLHFPENSALGVAVTRYIRSVGGTAIVTDPKAADAIVEFVQPETKTRIVLGTIAGQPDEYRLSYMFSFRVRDNKDRILLPVTPIVLTRDISYSVALANAKEIEMQSLYDDMQTDMVQRIMRRLTAINPIQ